MLPQHRYTPWTTLMGTIATGVLLALVPLPPVAAQEFGTVDPVRTDGNEELIKVYQSPDIEKKPIVVGITEFPFYGPENDPDEIIKRWGSMENYENEIPVIQLTDQNFEKLVDDDPNPNSAWLFVVGAKLCKPCEEMDFEWNKTAWELKSEVNVGYLDAVRGIVTADRFNVSGYPTIISIRNKTMAEYTGDRLWRKMAAFGRGVWEYDPKIKRLAVPPKSPVLASTWQTNVRNVKEFLGTVYYLSGTQPAFVASAVLSGMLFTLLIFYQVFDLKAIFFADEDIKRGAETVAAAKRKKTDDEGVASDSTKATATTSPTGEQKRIAAESSEVPVVAQRPIPERRKGGKKLDDVGASS